MGRLAAKDDPFREDYLQIEALYNWTPLAISTPENRICNEGIQLTPVGMNAVRPKQN